jgi:hypothetical protein
MTDKKNFMYWFLSICCMVFVAAIANRYHLWTIMDSKDATKISWLICAIFAGTSCAIGWFSYTSTATTDVMNRLWFVSDAMITLGMIGTVAGFLIMMGDGFNALDTKDPAAIQKTIQTVGTGMGTILVTTLMGLITSLLLKLQLVITDHEK